MNIMKFIIILCLLFYFIAFEIKTHIMTVCIDHYPPFQILSPKPQGENIAAINVLAKVLNYEVRFVEGANFKFCMRMLKEGQVDILAGLIDEPKRREFAYLFPYYNKPDKIDIKLVNSVAWHSGEDAFNATFIAQSGTLDINRLPTNSDIQKVLIAKLNEMKPLDHKGYLAENTLYFGLSKKSRLKIKGSDFIKIQKAFETGLFSRAIEQFIKSHKNLY